MNIKSQAVEKSLKQKIYALYILTGQDHYLLNEAACAIKRAWRKRGECDEKTLELESAGDWSVLEEEANSYSLFSDFVTIDARLNKKSIDATGKKTLQHYIQNINPRCLIILRAPLIPSKSLLPLASNQHTMLVQAYPLSSTELKRWIVDQLQKNTIHHEPQVPELIHFYTQGNMLACAQVIEKLNLICNDSEKLTVSMTMEQLSDQCDYQLYELTDACLSAQAGKAIHLLRQACANKTEPTLVLWLLSQEIRQLIQLHHLCAQSMSFATACNQLKIWSQRIRNYETTVARLSAKELYTLLNQCQQLDLQIKSNHAVNIWYGLENLALAIAT